MTFNEQPEHSVKYRPDIDGLRAFAVLSVIIFHAFPYLIKGGFVGVDIFFVISGFLISTIIIKSLDHNTFSFANFYIRRIRRIFPSLLLILITCWAVGWFTLTTEEYEQLGKYITAGSLFGANLIHWREVGYFDLSTETKPLIHLWSLGVEEQFYLLLPLILWFFRKNKRHFLIIIFVFICSLLLNLLGIQNHPTSVFYSPITRFWELLSGSLLAYFYLYKKKAIHPKFIEVINILCAKLFKKKITIRYIWLVNFASILGLCLLIWSIFNINNGPTFPWLVLY
jgi:peptidoglycan/LPS O-acetylase OafA/YrhL